MSGASSAPGERPSVERQEKVIREIPDKAVATWERPAMQRLRQAYLKQWGEAHQTEKRYKPSEDDVSEDDIIESLNAHNERLIDERVLDIISTILGSINGIAALTEELSKKNEIENRSNAIAENDALKDRRKAKILALTKYMMRMYYITNALQPKKNKFGENPTKSDLILREIDTPTLIKAGMEILLTGKTIESQEGKNLAEVIIPNLEKVNLETLLKNAALVLKKNVSELYPFKNVSNLSLREIKLLLSGEENLKKEANLLYSPTEEDLLLELEDLQKKLTEEEARGTSPQGTQVLKREIQKIKNDIIANELQEIFRRKMRSPDKNTIIDSRHQLSEEQKLLLRSRLMKESRNKDLSYQAIPPEDAALLQARHRFAQQTEEKPSPVNASIDDLRNPPRTPVPPIFFNEEEEGAHKDGKRYSVKQMPGQQRPLETIPDIAEETPGINASIDNLRTETMPTIEKEAIVTPPAATENNALGRKLSKFPPLFKEPRGKILEKPTSVAQVDGGKKPTIPDTFNNAATSTKAPYVNFDNTEETITRAEKTPSSLGKTPKPKSLFAPLAPRKKTPNAATESTPTPQEQEPETADTVIRNRDLDEEQTLILKRKKSPAQKIPQSSKTPPKSIFYDKLRKNPLARAVGYFGTLVTAANAFLGLNARLRQTDREKEYTSPSAMVAAERMEQRQEEMQKLKELEEQIDKNAQEQFLARKTLPETTPPLPPTLTETYTVQRGNSLWGIAENIFQQATGQEKAPITPTIVAAIKRENPDIFNKNNPDSTIYPGNDLKVTEAVKLAKTYAKLLQEAQPMDEDGANFGSASTVPGYDYTSQQKHTVSETGSLPAETNMTTSPEAKAIPSQAQKDILTAPYLNPGGESIFERSKNILEAWGVKYTVSRTSVLTAIVMEDSEIPRNRTAALRLTPKDKLNFSRAWLAAKDMVEYGLSPSEIAAKYGVPDFYAELKKAK